MDAEIMRSTLESEGCESAEGSLARLASEGEGALTEGGEGEREAFRVARAPEAAEPCGLCAILARGVKLDGRGRWCPDCDATLRRPGDPVPERPKKARVVPDRSAVPMFVYAVLRWHLDQLRAEGPLERMFVDASAGSSLETVLRQLALGATGDGCSGTKGTWRGRGREPIEVFPARQGDPARMAEAARRYAALDARSRRVADAVMADEKGDGVAQHDIGGRAFALTLGQRIALGFAEPAVGKRWLKHIAARDADSALAGMAELGDRVLREAARAWWAA